MNFDDLVLDLSFAIAEDNHNYGALRSWGYDRTLTLLRSISDVDLRRRLVNEPHRVGQEQVTPLLEAQDKGSPQLVNLLIEAGADPLAPCPARVYEHSDGKKYTFPSRWSALRAAIFYTRLDVVKTIVGHYADRKVFASNLEYAKSQLASGWYTDDSRGKEKLETMIKLMTPDPPEEPQNPN